MIPGNPISFLALGDSYTIGESVEEAQRWPVQLVRRLRAQGLAVQDPVIIARTGWTTDELAQGILDADPKGPFHLVTLLIGVNNQYRGRTLEEFRAHFEDLLGQAVGFAGGDRNRCLALSIPDWSVTPFAGDRDRGAISKEIDAFNKAAGSQAQTAGVRFVDVTEISREARKDPSLVAEDGLHPSGSMYGRWVEVLLPLVVSRLLGTEENNGRKEVP